MQMDDGHLEPIDQAAIKQHYADRGTGLPDVIFHVGEKVHVKGGEFKIKSMGRRMMILEGLPGTRIGK